MEKLIIQPARDHVQQWAALKRLFIAKRQSDADKNNKAVPRTTYGDVAQLVRYWHGQYLQEILHDPRALDRDLASRRRWIEHKRTLDSQQANADESAVYPANEWFWQQATRGLALYLESRKSVPTRGELVVDSVGETLREGASHVVDVVGDVADAVGEHTGSAFKTALLVMGGVTGAAIAIPLLIDALRD